MSKSALSLFVFSIYLYLLGFVLVVTPDTLLRIFEFPDAGGGVMGVGFEFEF